jgi:hypothetical protein
MGNARLRMTEGYQKRARSREMLPLLSGFGVIAPSVSPQAWGAHHVES